MNRTAQRFEPILLSVFSDLERRQVLIPAKPVLEIFSDYSCVWCYFNKAEVERIKTEFDVEILWRAFPLHPDMPEQGMPIKALFGNNTEMMDEKMQQLQDRAHVLGLPLARRTMISNSRPAQELAKWARSAGRGDAFHDAVEEAYFAEGRDIGSLSVLLDIVEAAGLSPREAQAVLSKETYRQEVAADWRFAQKLELVAAPTYLLYRSRLVGAQTYEKLRDMLLDNGVGKVVEKTPA